MHPGFKHGQNIILGWTSFSLLSPLIYPANWRLYVNNEEPEIWSEEPTLSCLHAYLVSPTSMCSLSLRSLSLSLSGSLSPITFQQDIQIEKGWFWSDTTYLKNLCYATTFPNCLDVFFISDMIPADQCRRDANMSSYRILYRNWDITVSDGDFQFVIGCLQLYLWRSCI